MGARLERVVMSGSVQSTQTYVSSYGTVTIPDDQDATVIGFGNAIILGANDTLDVMHGDGDMVTGSAGNTISVESSNNFTIDVPGAAISWDTPYTTMTVLDGADVTLVEPTGTPTINIGGSTTAENSVTGTSAVTVNFTQGVGALVDDPNAKFSVQTPGGASYMVTGLQAGASYEIYGASSNNPDVTDFIDVYSQPGATGTDVGNLTDFTDGTSATSGPGPDAFGIYQQINYYSSLAGQGTNVATIYNATNGTSLFSVEKFFTPLNNGSGIIDGVAYYSAPNATGTQTSATFDYQNGTSGSFQQGNGDFGIFQVGTFYNGPGETGGVFATSYDIVNGHSQTDYAGNGAFGVYQVLLRTEGPNGAGAIDQVVLNVGNGTSQVIAPAAGDASETLTFMSGVDGGGSVVSTQTVASGTALQDLYAFAGVTLFDPVYPSAASNSASGGVNTLHANTQGVSPSAVLQQAVRTAPSGIFASPAHYEAFSGAGGGVMAPARPHV
jgi:hypothetical protein